MSSAFSLMVVREQHRHRHRHADCGLRYLASRTWPLKRLAGSNTGRFGALVLAVNEERNPEAYALRDRLRSGARSDAPPRPYQGKPRRSNEHRGNVGFKKRTEHFEGGL